MNKNISEDLNTAITRLSKEIKDLSDEVYFYKYKFNDLNEILKTVAPEKLEEYNEKRKKARNLSLINHPASFVEK